MPDLPANASAAAVARVGAPMVLLRAALRFALPAAVVLVVGSFLLRGTAGGVTALVTATALLGIHYLTAWAATIAGRRSPQVLQAVTMFGFLARLALYGVLVAVLNDVAAIDAPVLATTVMVLLAVVLVVEARTVAHYSKFWWQVDGDQTTAGDHTTRPVSAQTADAVAAKDRA